MSCYGQCYGLKLHIKKQRHVLLRPVLWTEVAHKETEACPVTASVMDEVAHKETEACPVTASVMDEVAHKETEACPVTASVMKEVAHKETEACPDGQCYGRSCT